MKNPEEVTLLIVDDEEGIRDVLKSYFEIDGYKIYTAIGGHQALEVVKNNNIDFIISDVRMPEGDGITFLTKLKTEYPELPVIIMVTGQSDLTRETAMEKGAVDLLIKPVSPEIIEEFIVKHVLQFAI